MPGSRFCHACGAPLQGTPPRTRIGSFVAAVRVLISVSLGAWIGGWIASFADAEAMPACAFLALVVGVVMLGLGLHGRYRWAAVLGATHVVLCGYLVALIALFQWTPDQARNPMLIHGMICLALLVPLSIHTWRAAPQDAHPGQCRTCGYLLYGLTEPRCPECGTPFDPTDLHSN